MKYFALPLLALTVASPALAHEAAIAHAHGHETMFWALGIGAVGLFALGYLKIRG